MRQTLSVLFLLALSLSFVSAATVTGKVVGTDGKPIKGASVYLYLYDERKPLDLPTDAEGGFTVDIDLTSKQANAYLASVIAYAPGYTLTSAMLKANGNVITLSAGTTHQRHRRECGRQTAGRHSGQVVLLAGNAINHAMKRRRVPDEWRDTLHRHQRGRRRLDTARHPAEGTVSLALDDDRYVHEEQEITLVAGEKATPCNSPCVPVPRSPVAC